MAEAVIETKPLGQAVASYAVPPALLCPGSLLQAQPSAPFPDNLLPAPVLRACRFLMTFTGIVMKISIAGTGLCLFGKPVSEPSSRGCLETSLYEILARTEVYIGQYHPPFTHPQYLNVARPGLLHRIGTLLRPCPVEQHTNGRKQQESQGVQQHIQ